MKTKYPQIIPALITVFASLSLAPVARAVVVNYVGVQNDLGPGWRTSSTNKTLDIDGDNVLGTDGYDLVNLTPAPPDYVSQMTILTTITGGDPGYAMIDDPLNLPSLFGTGTLNPFPGEGVSVDLFQFVLNSNAVGKVIRVGLMVDNLDDAVFNAASLELDRTNVALVSSGPVVTTNHVFLDNIPDWFFFDIAGAAAGDTFIIRGTGGSSGAATLGGVAFDSLQPSVTNTNDDGSAGSLRALVAAYPGATITFDPSLDGETILVTNGPIVLASDYSIDASALADGIQINGDSNSCVFVVNNGVTAALTSLTITNGYDDTGNIAGGIRNDGDLTLNQCSFFGNHIYAGDGGGIANFGTLVVTSCVITSNSTFGGGNGGGGLANYGTLGLNATTFSGNSSSDGLDGGGAIDDYGMLTVTNCTFSSNSCLGNGGAIVISEGDVTITQCTFSGNHASNLGGAISDYDTLTLNDCTISGNSAGSAGGVYVVAGTLPVTNTIVAGNTGTVPDFGGAFTTANNLIGDNPMLAPLGFYGGPTEAMPPLPGSPAIDAGTNSVTNFLATDQRGAPRLAGAHVDIGAVESVGPLVSTTGDSGNGSLRDAVTFAAGISNLTFAPALSGQTILLTSGPITFFNDLVIDASSLAHRLQINGNSHSCVFVVNTGVTAEMDSLTITNGFDGTGNFAGGILNDGTLTLSNCLIAGNVETNGAGGGILNFGTMALSECGVSGNVASGGAGGGIYNVDAMAISNCTIISNSASVGGGGIFSGGALTIDNSTLSGNSADNSTGGCGLESWGGTTILNQTSVSANSGANLSRGGGGIQAYGTTMAINSCTISGNSISADANKGGGGIYVSSSAMSISNSTIASNAVSGGAGGGGIFTQNDELTINNCTISGNSAGEGPGGGIDRLASGSPYMTNTIVAGNVAATFTNISGAYNGMYLLTDGDPLLAPLGNYGGPTQTMPPLLGSPAIDAGTDSVTNLFTTDQRGHPRLSGAHVDLGAVELQQSTAVTLAASNVTTSTATLNGVVTPNELATTWYIQYGTTTNYGATSATNMLASGFTPVSVTDSLTGLVPNTTYHYQVIATDAISAKAGADVEFTTVPLTIGDSEIVVAITAPADKLSTASSNVTVTGTLKSSGSIPAAVQVTVNNNAPALATQTAAKHGSIPWTYSADLVPGSNVITAVAIDSNSSQIISLPVSHTVFFVTNALSTKDKSTLTLTTVPNGAGKFSGQKPGVSLELNKVFTVTASPGANYIFANWTAGTNLASVLGSNATLAFIMQSNLVLQANFVTNPFPAVAGVYNGLFSPETGVTEESSGFLTATLKSSGRGAYSGKLMLDGGAYSFSGAFDLSGNSEVTVARNGNAPVQVILHLDLDLSVPDNLLTGYVVNFASNGWTSELLANRAPFDGKSNKATNYTGKYTLVINPGAGAPTNEPGGYSYATLAGTSAGGVTLSGSLADKTAFSQSTTVSTNGNIPLYVPLYAKKGSIQGWLTLADPTNSQASPVQMVAGTGLAWFKPAVAKSLYPSGFTNTDLTATGSIYTNGFAQANGTLTVGNGDLTNTLTISNVVVAGSKVSSASGEVSGTITTSTGILSLTITPKNGAKITAKGVLLDDNGGTNAGGWFPGADQSGYFLLQP